MFQVFRPYLGFSPDPKHFIVNSEQNVVKFAGKWGKMYWKMQFLYKIFRQNQIFSEMKPETHTFFFFFFLPKVLFFPLVALSRRSTHPCLCERTLRLKDCLIAFVCLITIIRVLNFDILLFYFFLCEYTAFVLVCLHWQSVPWSLPVAVRVRGCFSMKFRGRHVLLLNNSTFHIWKKETSA